MNTVCEKSTCVGCKACMNVCSTGALSFHDDYNCTYIEIDAQKCIGCNRCFKVCQNNGNIELNPPLEWYQGWDKDEESRHKSSSGGVSYSIAKEFIKMGGIVYSCVFDDGIYAIRRIEDVNGLEKTRGSKYVKSYSENYSEIKALLMKHKKILFIGLPCQVYALKKFIGAELSEDLYLIDLICHGTPSNNFLQKFLLQNRQRINIHNELSFRKDGYFTLIYDGKALSGSKKKKDLYTIGFLSGLTYTDNCYECKFAQINRCSDITLGDSWGTELKEEFKKGVSLILVQSKKGIDLIRKCDIELHSVDLDRAISNNKQLRHPSDMPKRRNDFWKKVKQDKDISRLIMLSVPKAWVKNRLKWIIFGHCR